MGCKMNNKQCVTVSQMTFFNQGMLLLGLNHFLINRVYVRGHKYGFGPTQTHFSPSRKARVKMSSEILLLLSLWRALRE